MQVIVFDKFFKCVYHIKDVPNNWHFDKIHELLDLQHKASEYQAIRLADWEEFCIDEYVYKDSELKLTDQSCYK